MSYGLKDYDRRYRQQTKRALLRLAIFLAAVAGTAAFAYQTGVEQVVTREDRLRQEAETLRLEIERARDSLARAERRASEASTALDELTVAYERDVPTGVRRDLLALIDQRLAQGVSADRIGVYVNAAAEPANCAPSTTRRFIVQTPTYSGPNTAAGFAEGRITVTGQGANAPGPNGQPQGYFDPAQEVTITFTRIGGESSSATGVLPLHHVVVLGGEEHRFTVVEGERSMVNVTADSCPLAPES